MVDLLISISMLLLLFDNILIRKEIRRNNEEIRNLYDMLYNSVEDINEHNNKKRGRGRPRKEEK